MSQIDLLIANELPLHREVLVSAFRTLRPDIVVHAIAHHELDLVLCDLRPLVVICSAANATMCSCSPVWIALYPDERDEAVIHIDGEQRTIPNASIHQLMSVMDEVRASR
jgi:hypothetical protein